MRPLAAVFVLALCACDPQSEGEAVTRVSLDGSPVAAPAPEPVATPTPDGPCSSVTFETVPIVHCIADPARHAISTALGPKGDYYRTFARLGEARGVAAAPPAFAVNGGMFEENGRPVGYYVENGERRSELVRTGGTGNFHLKPNGVFYGANGAWHVRTTEDFYASVSERPTFGTQSGPMLVIDGELHPEFADDDPSRYTRNGVGVDRQGRAHFAMSENAISFGSFARFFRDVARTPNALYLDGSVSALWYPGGDRRDAARPLGPLIVVENRE